MRILRIITNESFTSFDLVNPSSWFLDNSRVLKSTGMPFLGKETSGTINDCNFRHSGRPRRRRGRVRGSPRRCTKRRSQWGGQGRRGVSHRESRRNQEISFSTHAGSSWERTLDDFRTGGAKRAMTDEIWGRSRRQWKGRRSREAWPSIDSRSVKEKRGGGWQLFFRILEKLRERSSLARRAVRAARSLPLSPEEPAGALRFQSKVQSSLCPSSSGVVINDGDVVPPAWRCESCRQTTLVDGVVPRFARRGFSEVHFSVKL